MEHKTAGKGGPLYADSELPKNSEIVVLENVTVSWALKSQSHPEQMLPEPGHPQCMVASTSGQLK